MGRHGRKTELFVCVAMGALFCAWVFGRQPAMAGQELPQMTSEGKPAISSVSPNRVTVPRFEKFELTVDLSASYDNPFDPEQVALEAEFTSPSGKKIGVSGFFYQPYRNRNEADDKKRPLLDADGKPCWKVRFSPTEVGPYEYALRLKNRFGEVNEEVKWGPAGFECAESANHGFIRVSTANPRYFQFDDGTPFFAVGQNLQNDWPYYFHFRPLAESGCNAVRIWAFCHWGWLEWSFKKEGFPWAKEGDWMRSYAGAGKYNQRIAWLGDHVLANCERDGLRLMFCLGNATGHGEFSKSGKDRYDSWGGNPYNVANGGFLDDPTKCWTDERVKKLYRQRLRYIVARWAYSPNVWAWELWNELGEATPEMTAWHKEMAEYLRTTDPNRHLVTTSTWQREEKFAAIWDSNAMDFTQSHIYRPLPVYAPRIGTHLQRWQVPHVVGEGAGPESAEKGGKEDPEGTQIHNALWAPVMLGAAGTTLPWWWRQQIEPNNLFYHYRAIADFVKDVPWTDCRFKPVLVKSVSLAVQQKKASFSPVLVAPSGPSWGSRAARNRFAVKADGVMTDVEQFAGTLFGATYKEWRNPPTIEVDYPVPGAFVIHVSSSVHGVLDVLLDGKRVMHDESLKGKQESVWKDFVIDVPAGRHEITLDNAGSITISVYSIILTNYRDALKYPDVDVLGLQSDDLILLWMHNRLNQLEFRARGFAAGPVGPGAVRIGGTADGPWRVEWWDTYKGKITGVEEAQARGGTLELRLPVIQTDVACKIKRVR